MTRFRLLLCGLALALALHGCAALPAPSGSMRAEVKAVEKGASQPTTVEASLVFECKWERPK